MTEYTAEQTKQAQELKRMAFAIKTVTRVRAWELGTGSDMEKEMLRNGKIIAHPDGTFEVITYESTESKGQTAFAGDFFKVDERGFPCPNSREFFLQNHRHLEGDWFIQTARPLKIWRLGDPECEELRFLLNNGLLSIHPEDQKHCFSAPLWGTTETAAADAVVIFYSVERDPEGKIKAVNFNFADAEYFSSHYRVIPFILSVTARYLWLPVRRGNAVLRLHFRSGSQIIQEVDIALAPDHAEYYTAIDVGPYIGTQLEITGLPDMMPSALPFHDDLPPSARPFRPQIHFTAPIGWINDPNGLVYADGIWHLFHQWNPYGTEWGNMHWGHAESHDLITWKHKGVAMAPDEYGTMFSGCGWPDRENTAGFGKSALLFFYTSAGGSSQWSAEAGNLHTQCLAVSQDHGEALVKKGIILRHIKGGNRDPKVFRHRESNAYIMVLYLDGNEFAVFRSHDLIHWNESQRFQAEKMRECPDLFELAVDNEPGRKKWVFWSADGFYRVGNFDGYRFVPESAVLSAYDTKLPYAAQTYAGITDRRISIAWLRTENDRGNFRGMMSFPAELSLFRQGNRYRIRFRPVRELWDCFRLSLEYPLSAGSMVLSLSGKPVIVEINWLPGQEKTVVAGETRISVSTENNQMLLLIDHGIMEYWADDGMKYGAVEADPDVLSGRMEIQSGTESIRIYEYCR